jgi:MFS family permease
LRKVYLEITVFICGAVLMAFEIVGARMLGPWFGTSFQIWTGIIGVMLLSMAAGYFLGGRLADRKPRADILALLIFLAGVIIFITTLLKEVVMLYLTRSILNILTGSLVASVIFFMIPSVLLGMVSPFAARIKMKSVVQSGSTIGNLYAISTAGSIAGVFLAGFYLIPGFRITDILQIIGTILVAISLFVNAFYFYTRAALINKK